MTRVIYYSPTQLSMFSACQRKWFFSYPLGYKPPETESQRTGKKIHGELEAYVKDGVWPADPRAEEALRHLPPLVENLVHAEPRVDRSVVVPGVTDVPGAPVERHFLGFIDLLSLTDPAVPHIVDYKTMSDLVYAKTEYELEKDLQLNCYAQHIFETVAPTANLAKVTHIAIQTRKTIKSKATSALLSREHTQEHWNRYLKVFQEMEQVRVETDAHKVPQNLKECDAYGGCYHKSMCFSAMFMATPIPPKHANDQENTEVIVPPDSTRRKPGDQPATPDTARKIAPKENTMNDKLAALLKNSAAPANIDAPPKSKQEVLATAAAQEEALVEATTPIEEQATQDLPPTTQPLDPAAEEVTSPGAPIPAAASRAVLEAPAVLPKAANDDPEPTAHAGSDAMEYLFIDCMPMKGFREKAEPFYTWVAPLLEEVRQVSGLSYEFHDFRKGVGAISDKMRTAKLPKAMIIYSGTPTAKIAIEVLVPRAKRIIQGVVA